MFDGRFLANLLVTTFAQPVCKAEETTPYDVEMAELIARGGHPHSEYMPPSVREEFNHTMTFEQQMLPVVFLFAVSMIGVFVHHMNKKPLITSPVYNDKIKQNTESDDNPKVKQQRKLN